MTSLLSLIAAAAVGSALAVLTSEVSQGDAFMLFSEQRLGLLLDTTCGGKT